MPWARDAADVPVAILGLLLGSIIIAMCGVGIAGGLGQYHGMPARILLTLLLSGAMLTILDLDQPLRGLTQIDQGPMMQIKEIVDRDPETMP